MNKMIESLVIEDIRERFYYESSRETEGWPVVRVKVFDKNVSSVDPIYEYDRNFSMMDTFEPFRTWDEDKETWRHFALISPVYVNFEVLDLDNREIIAKNPPLLMTQEQADGLNGAYAHAGKESNYKAGDDFSQARFCPAGFHVPDMLDVITGSDLDEMKSGLDNDFYEQWIKDFLERRTFGYESGCVWGDDWSLKVQAIDLTKILEGEVSDDDRFGYLVLQGELKDLYNKSYYDDPEASPYLYLNAPVRFRFDENDSTKVAESSLFSDVPNYKSDAF